MTREPWKPLAWSALPPITPEQAWSIVSGAGFKLGVLMAEIEDRSAEQPKVVLREMPHVTYSFWKDSLDKGYYLPWNTKEWLAEVFYEKVAARLAAELFRDLSDSLLPPPS